MYPFLLERGSKIREINVRRPGESLYKSFLYAFEKQKKNREINMHDQRVFFGFFFKKARKFHEINVIVRDGTNDLMNFLLLLSKKKKSSTQLT